MILYLASIYSTSSSTSKPSNVGFLKSNPLSSSSGVIGSSRLQVRREGNVKVKRNYSIKKTNSCELFCILASFIRGRTSAE